jgi:hypothetical protein
MTAKVVEPDGLKARDRLILEAARSFTNAIGISKDIGDGHDDFTAFLGQVHRLQDASSDEWTWPSHGPLLDLKAHFFDMEEPLRLLKSGLETLHELSIGSDPIPKEVIGFMADTLTSPIAWIDRLFSEAYRRQPVVRPAEEVQGECEVRDLRPADEVEDAPPLDPTTRERLQVLLNEAIDMNVALRRLLSTGDISFQPASGLCWMT